MIQITWVNHASFVARVGNTALICDPWLEGPAFDNGWSLLSPTRFGYEDFGDISHLFFSHEHPDHFNPPNVRRIPEKYRPNITVLFHETRDKRVVKLCNSWGFQIKELPEHTWVPLCDEVAVLCGRQGLIDSWLAIRAGGQTVLNMNDCVFTYDSELQHVADCVGQPDVLFTQFSYANWVGNPGDQASHRRHALEKLKEMARQVRILRPKMVVPCASFVWFSHQENYFANREANRIWDVYDFTTKTLGCKTVVLYPGDQWRVGDTEHDSAEALRKYRADYAAVEDSPPLTKSAPVSLDQLRQAHEAYRRKALARNNRHLLRAIRPAVVFIADLGVKVRISLLKGIETLNDHSAPDITLSSEALQYCYLWDWGGDTLAVNGRYTVPAGGDPSRFFQNFRIAAYNATGFPFDVPLLMDIAARYVGRKLGINALQKVRR
jgi:UDP-MurNAc hydroxylase